MKKLLRGIIDFRHRVLPEYRETFARLALGQNPDALLIACSDSRVVPNLFASTDPGDLFVVRNVGNLIAPAEASGLSSADESEAAALEFSVLGLHVKDIIVCGHSECGAMQALLQGRSDVEPPNLRAWLRHAEPCVSQLEARQQFAKDHSKANRLSQLNVLQQLEHLQSYPLVRERMAQGSLQLHAWWFELRSAEVQVYDPRRDAFCVLDDEFAELLLKQAR